ncbi:MAG TPA: hypothetical protein VF255_03860 [Solirubrobacterales bacterium]
MERSRPFEGRLWRKGEKYTSELSGEDDCGRRQRDLSRQLTVLVDVLYALVLVAGAEAYSSLFTSGMLDEPSRSLPVVLALVFVYFTAIHSFIDYHLASEDQPYQFLDKSKRGRDLVRFYLDIVIVGAYSFLLLECHGLLSDPAADIFPMLAALPGIFALFLYWGRLRRKSGSNPKAKGSYKIALLWLCLLSYGVLAGIYKLIADGWVGNSIFLLLALAIMLLYRWINWDQNRWCKE